MKRLEDQHEFLVTIQQGILNECIPQLCKMLSERARLIEARDTVGLINIDRAMSHLALGIGTICRVSNCEKS